LKFDILIPTYKPLEKVQKLIDEIEYYTPEKHRLIVSCQPLPASKNRNYCLSYADSEIMVMMDDDIINFYPGWLTNLIYPMMNDKNIIITSARLLDKNKNANNNMGMVKDKTDYAEIREAYNIDGVSYKRVTPAAIAFRKTDIKFDEVFLGSGYEDTAWMNDMSKEYNGMKFVVNNCCQLIHINNRSGQDDEKIWQHNHDHYCKKYEWDEVAKNQKWWKKR